LLLPLLLNRLPDPADAGMPGKHSWSQDPPGLTWLPGLGNVLPNLWCNASQILDKQLARTLFQSICGINAFNWCSLCILILRPYANLTKQLSADLF
jgi:hypothetical protein